MSEPVVSAQYFNLLSSTVAKGRVQLEAAELEDRQIWVWGRKSEGGTGSAPLAADISGPTPAYRH